MTDLTQTLQEMRKKYVAHGVSNGNLNIARKAKNATIVAESGKEFIDFAGAIGVMNVGHCHPKIVEAAKNQIDEHIHPGFNVMLYESYLQLCKRLCEVTAGDHEKKAILFNTGAEAVENTVKIARRYTGRQGVVTFDRGFHGRTNMTMAMTSKVDPYKIGFGPFASEVYKAPFPYVYQRPAHMSEEEYVDLVIAEFDAFFKSTVSAENVACLVMEPIQGEGGFVAAPKKFMEHVYNFCQENGIVFVADEIQTGFARTGKLFAMEHYGIVPDLQTASKSLAAGFPLSAVIGKAEIMDAAQPGELGGTFSGSPVACSAALAVLEVIEEENLNEKAEKLGQAIEDKLTELQKSEKCIGDIRRVGAMVAAEIVVDPETRKPDAEKTSKITGYANENGLLLLSAGINSNVIRFLTPLTITDEELAKGFEILEAAFKA